jgi:GAF domain-containing protein
MGDRPLDELLASADETIAAQSRELEHLRTSAAVVERFREALEVAATWATVGSPVGHTRLLEMVVETAAHIISAKAGALLLLDEESEELIFAVAVGGKAEEVKRFRVPLGHGVAGLVASTGQPMSIAGSDWAETAQEIAEGIGYQPRSVLCVPLFYGGDVVGVLELLDKVGAEAFGSEDMDALSLFANQAAVAIAQSKAHQGALGILRSALTGVGKGAEELMAVAGEIEADMERDETNREGLELARLLHDVASRGPEERALCTAILRALAAYVGPSAGTRTGSVG